MGRAHIGHTQVRGPVSPHPPADRDRVRAAFTAARGVDGRYETDFRILVEDEIRWISARGLGSDLGMHKGYMHGIFLDVTGQEAG